MARPLALSVSSVVKELKLKRDGHCLTISRKSYPKMISDCQGTPMMLGPRLAIVDQLVDGKVDVLRYLPQQNGGNVSVRMEGYCDGTPVDVAKLLVGSSLPDLFKTGVGPVSNYVLQAV
jgi:hypothetical protein